MSKTLRYFVLDRSRDGFATATEVTEDFLAPHGEFVVAVEDLAPDQARDYHEVSATCWYDDVGRLSMRSTEPLPVALAAFATLAHVCGDDFRDERASAAAVLPLPSVMPGFETFVSRYGVL